MPPIASRSPWTSLALVGLAAVLATCGGSGSSAEDPVSPQPPPTSTAPRVLLNDAATMARLRDLLQRNVSSAQRLRQHVDAELAGAQSYAFSPWMAALMGQLTGEARYCTFAVERTEADVAAEESRIAAGQVPEVAGDSYLEVGPRIGNVALVLDWCRAQTTPAQRQRWIAYGDQAVWNVWNPLVANWSGRLAPWSGWSVDNPVNNYYYSFLEATMLMGLATEGESSSASQWRDTFRRVKLEQQLFPVFTRDLTGGGSREGTGYGTAMKNLFRLYDWWERSTGERVADRTAHTLASIPHLLHAMVPTLDRLVPTGDHARDSTAALFDYHREYLLELIRLFPAERLAGVARSALASSSVPAMTQGFMLVADFLYDPDGVAAVPLDDLNTTYWGPGTGHLAMRSSWQADATLVHTVCGPLTESHAHLDQGSFTMYAGRWLAYDANIDSHSGIEQAEALHNLVRLERAGAVVPQRKERGDCELQALGEDAARSFTYARTNALPVYAGDEAVTQMQRELVFVKPGVLVVFDRVGAAAGTTPIWTLNLPTRPTVAEGRVSTSDGGHSLDVYSLAPAGLSPRVLEWPALNPELTGGFRLDVADAPGRATRFLHVLAADGAVLSAQRSDAAGRTGVQIALKGGGTALLRFVDDAPGGEIELRSAGGAVVFAGALPSGVTTPALFVR